MFWRYLCPKVNSAVFTDKLPNSRGVSKSQIDRDFKGGRDIQKPPGLGGSWAWSSARAARKLRQHSNSAVAVTVTVLGPQAGSASTQRCRVLLCSSV